MLVLKFGGSSIASSDAIRSVVQIIKKQAKTTNVILVFSAMGTITNQLITIGKTAAKGTTRYTKLLETLKLYHYDVIGELFQKNIPDYLQTYVSGIFDDLDEILKGVFLLNDFSPKISDRVVSAGELLSTKIINAFLLQEKLDSQWVDSRKIIKTDTSFSKALVNFKNTDKNIELILNENSSNIIVFQGFISSNTNNETTTLGRGGSDYTAAIIANAIKAKELQIWTDVSGMFTANPTLVKQARPIDEISYQEAMELSHFGASVLYPPTIQPILEKAIPIRIKNTFKPKDKGTLITKEKTNNTTVIGISHIANIALITLTGSGMVGISGFSKRLFESLAQENINIVLITQASSEHSICIGIETRNITNAQQTIQRAFETEIERGNVQMPTIEKGLAIVALVGEQMKNHHGISGKMFSALGRNNVNITAIAQGASQNNISAVIKEKDVKKALNTLHDVFFDNVYKVLNLFVVGVGNVGKKLLNQILDQQSYLIEKENIKIKLIGVANSSKMYFDESGIDLENWSDLLTNGMDFSLSDFTDNILSLNYRNSIFVDNTASEKIANNYTNLLRNSIAVVTCNKIACSSDFNNYQHLKYLAKEYLAPFLFETNVGAGLPVIDTLKNLILSGDTVTKIQAVLSGSLNFIFNKYDTNKSFVDIVKQAGTEGYTEPDPRIDLSGIDVARKILILIRESGYTMELENIDNQSFLPKSCQNTKSVEVFYQCLAKEETYFKKMYHKALQNNSKLKYVATFENGKAKVALQEVSMTHPFYTLEGKDNIVLFYTNRYVEQPLIIKGAGAGAEVTASGLFADIIRIGNR
jgi:aspartokinase/homoserine dehydrogenase 1